MPLFWLSLSFTAGILTAACCACSAQDWLTLAMILLAGSWLEYHFCNHTRHPLLSSPLFRIPFTLLVACLALGAWRFQLSQDQLAASQLAPYADGESREIVGQIISFPEDSSSSTRAVVQAQKILEDGREIPVRGRLELRLPGGFHLSYGDVLLLDGPLTAVLSADRTAYSSYLARHGILQRMVYPEITTLARGEGNRLMSGLYEVRNRAEDILLDQIPFPESTLLCGILLGVDWQIPDYLEEAFRSCGVLHIIAISGFNISLISNLIIRLTRHFLSPRKAGAAAILGIALYTLLVGADPAVVRAAIMGSISIPAYYLGRKIIPLHSLTVVAAIMLAGSPMLLWDTGFQLSFLACLGLITMADPILKWSTDLIQRKFSEKAASWWQPILSLLVTTLIAQFSVQPVLFTINPSLSLNTLTANLALLPIQPLIMGLGGLAVIFGFLLPPLGRLFGGLVWPFLYFTDRVALNLGFQPNAEIPAPSWLFPLSLAAVLLGLTFFSVKRIRELNQPHSG